MMVEIKIHTGFSVLRFALLTLLIFNLYCVSAKKAIEIYELKRGNFSVRVTNWGAIVLSVMLPDSKGNLDDVALGYDTLAPYVENKRYFGAIVGRVANRIGRAQFTLNGTRYKLVANDGKNMLHGGHRGFSKVIWTVKKKGEGKCPFITLTYHSFDGEQGFPGDLDVSVTYKIVGDYSLAIDMKAKAINKATPVNLAQHTYWNLAGHNSGTILSHSLQLFASHITPVDKELIPTGEIAPIKNTPYDFLTPRPIKSQIYKLENGYDINYVLDSNKPFKRVAVVHDNNSGRRMDIWATAPGVQLYTSNKLVEVGKGGDTYKPFAGLCLETQGFPDSVNHPNFPSQIIEPGETYKHYMFFKFSF